MGQLNILWEGIGGVWEGMTFSTKVRYFTRAERTTPLRKLVQGMG